MQFRLFVTLTILLMSSGCTTLPKPKSFDDKGCGIHQFDDAWIARNGIRISWTGACKSGLMEGDGQLTVVNSSGKIIATYKGWMKGGYYNTSYADGGKLIDKGMALLVDGDFRYEGKFTWGKISQGKKFAKGVLVYDGHFVEGKYMIGKLYLTNGGRLDGYFDSNAVSYGADGRGVIDAKYIQPNGSIGYWIVDQKIYRTEKESRAAYLKMNSDKMIALRHDAQVAQENYENVYKKALGSLGSIAFIAADEYLAQNKAANPPSQAVTASPTPASTASAVTTVSRNPYGNNPPTTTSSDIDTRSVISEPPPSQSKRLPYKANANACIGLRGNQLVNNCSRGVWITFCVLNPRQTKNFFDSSDAFKCPSGGLEQISGNSANGLVWHGEINFFACYAEDIGTMKNNFYGTEPRTATPGTMQGSYTGAYHGLCAGHGADGRQEMGGSVYAK